MLAAIDSVLPQLSDDHRPQVFALKAYLHSRQDEHREVLEALAAFNQNGGEKSFFEFGKQQGGLVDQPAYPLGCVGVGGAELAAVQRGPKGARHSSGLFDHVH